MKRVPIAAAVALLAACGSFRDRVQEMRAEARTKRDFQQNPTWIFQATTLDRILASPTTYEGIHVKFQAMMNRHDETLWEAYYSGMSSEKFYSFSIWPGGVKLWTSEGWAQSISTVYVSKDNPNIRDFFEVGRFEIVEIRAMVKSDFRNFPWLECFYIDKVEDAVYSQEAIEGLIAGMTAADERRNAAATQGLEKALEGTLPDEARFIAHYTLGGIYLGRAKISRTLDDHMDAVMHFGAAVGYDAQHKGARVGLKEADEAYEKRRMILEREAEGRK